MRLMKCGLTQGLIVALAIQLLLVGQRNTTAQTAPNDGDEEEAPVPDEKRCSLCVDHNLSPEFEADLLLNVTVQVPDVGEVSCETLRNALPLLLELQDERCQLIQSASTICGCPPPIQPPPTDPCRLCLSSGDDAGEEGELRVVKEEWQNVPVTYLGQAATCGLVEVSMENTLESTVDLCHEGRSLLAISCGCGIDASEGTPSIPPTAGEEQKQCHACWDGSDVPSPENILDPVLLSGYGLEVPDGANITCSTLSSVVQALTADNDLCPLYQVFVGGLCGCPSIPDHCEFCPTDDEIPFPDIPYIPAGAWDLPTLPTCQETADILAQLPEIGSSNALRPFFDFIGRRDDICTNVRRLAYYCGCNGGQRQYFGADSVAKRAALVWTSRATGFLSFIGSCAILWDVLWHQRKKSGAGSRNRLYRSIMGGLSFCDLFSSLSWMAATAPLHKTFHFPYGSFDSGVYGAIGDSTSCKAQGFIHEFGMIGSILYNTTLCFYYQLVIVRGKREQDMRRYGWVLAFSPLIVALAFAGSGFEHYAFSLAGCLVPSPPTVSSWKVNATFVVGPLACALAAVTILMAVIYCHVRRTTRASERWQFPSTTSSRHGTNSSSGGFQPQSSSRSFRDTDSSSTRSKLSKRELEVIWQCSSFLLAFYSTWILFFAAQFASDVETYGFWFMVMFFTPLQGFLNLFVYARPRMIAYLRQRRALKERERLHTRVQEIQSRLRNPSQVKLSQASNREVLDSEDGARRQVPQAEKGSVTFAADAG